MSGGKSQVDLFQDEALDSVMGHMMLPEEKEEEAKEEEKDTEEKEK